MAVLPEATDALEGFVPSYDAVDDPRDAKDPFLGASAAPSFPCTGAAGFLNRPLTDGRLVGGRGARILEADLGTGMSGARFSGLGVLDRRAAIALGGGTPYMDVRLFAGVGIADGVWSDWMLLLFRKGVPSMVGSWWL
jgi:hypothetical protein